MPTALFHPSLHHIQFHRLKYFWMLRILLKSEPLITETDDEIGGAVKVSSGGHCSFIWRVVHGILAVKYVLMRRIAICKKIIYNS